MSTDETAIAKALACPNCGSANVKPKRSFRSAGAWFGLFAVCLFLAATMPYPSPPQLTFGWAALAVAIAVTISAAIGKNSCKDCKHEWR